MPPSTTILAPWMGSRLSLAKSHGGNGPKLDLGTSRRIGGYVFTEVDPRGLAVTNVWDALGRLVKRVYPDGAGITNLYQNLDLVVSYDRMGFTNRNAYNSFRQLSRSTNANGNVRATCMIPSATRSQPAAQRQS
jgi:hypothetical protein